MCYAMSFVILNTPYGWCPLVHPARFAPGPEDFPATFLASPRALADPFAGVPRSSLPWVDSKFVDQTLQANDLRSIESHSSIFRSWTPPLRLPFPVKGIDAGALSPLTISLEELDKVQADFGSPMARIEFTPSSGFLQHPLISRVRNDVDTSTSEFPYYSFLSPAEVKDLLSDCPLTSWHLRIDMASVPSWLQASQNRLEKYVRHIAERILNRDTSLLTESQQGLEYLLLDTESRLYRYLAASALCSSTRATFMWVPNQPRPLQPASNYPTVSSASRQGISHFARNSNPSDELWTLKYFGDQAQLELQNQQPLPAAPVCTASPDPSSSPLLTFENLNFHPETHFACDGEFLVGCVPNESGGRDDLIRRTPGNTIFEFVFHIPSSSYVLMCTKGGKGVRRLGQSALLPHLQTLFQKHGGSGEPGAFSFSNFIHPKTKQHYPTTCTPEGYLDLRRLSRFTKASLPELEEMPRIPSSSLTQILALFAAPQR